MHPALTMPGEPPATTGRLVIAPTEGLMNRETGGHWVRLQTLTRVRWFAILGQFLAISVAHFGLGLIFSITLAYFVVAVSVASNVLSAHVFPPTRRLSDGEVTADADLRHDPTVGAAVPDRRAVQPLRAAAAGAGDDRRDRAAAALDPDRGGSAAALLASLLALSHEPMRAAGRQPGGAAEPAADRALAGDPDRDRLHRALCAQRSRPKSTPWPRRCWPCRWPWRASRS
jgi:hypothetical protein